MSQKDALGIYLSEVRKIPLLTVEEEKELIQQAQDGNWESHKKLIRGNLRLVIKIAKRYFYLGIPFLDLIEEGNIGLMKALKKYQLERKHRFATYASWWIKQAIVRAVANYARTIRIPVYQSEELARYKKTNKKLFYELGRYPTVKEIASKMRLSLKKIREIKELTAGIISLDKFVDEEKKTQVGDILFSRFNVEKNSSFFKIFDDLERKEEIVNLLELLDEREKEIVCIRQGLFNGRPHTLQQTSEIFKISKERIRQIEKKAIDKLKLFVEMERKE